MLNMIIVLVFYVINELLLEKVFSIRTKLYNKVKVKSRYILICAIICLPIFIISDTLLHGDFKKYIDLYGFSLMIFLVSNDKEKSKHG